VEPDAIRAILRSARTVAVVGMSPNPERDSHAVGRYLMDAGYSVIPVNPGADEILGRRCYRTLAEVPGPVDIVDIFRRPEHVPPIVEEAIRIGARVVWMQDGVVHEEAAARARAAGLTVVMDRCMLRDHRALMAP
jgi:predicted CoA-binding protein